ncbi:MAG: DUF2007 domain-containing protein [Anaerolineae bacterium]|nr:DUF2007 domain-containing protein [Anaerolineae bacterium]
MDNDPQALVKRRGPDQRTWYVVAQTPDLAVAAIPAGLLRSAGIPVFLFREALSASALPLSVGLLGGVDVAVPEAYYLEARALLGEAASFLDELEPGDEET